MATDTAHPSTPSGASNPAAGESRDLCRAVLESKSADLLVLSLPGTAYQLHLKPGVPIASIATAPGKRIIGRVHGRSLRMHAAVAGGRFIEPVYGHPRIVQGTIAETDRDRNRVLVDMVIPAWLEVADGQQASDFAIGTLVNMYVESGMTFTPA